MPKKKSEAIRNKQVNTRITSYTFKLITDAAEKSGMGLSEWMRKLIYSELAKLEKRTREDEALIVMGVKITPVERKSE